MHTQKSLFIEQFSPFDWNLGKKKIVLFNTNKKKLMVRP